MIYRKDINKLHDISITAEEEEILKDYDFLINSFPNIIPMGCLSEKYEGGNNVSDVILKYNNYCISVELREIDLITKEVVEEVDKILVPYRNVNEVGTDSKTLSYIVPASIEYKNGSAIKGALIGGAVAGAPGAIMGAAISSNTPRKVVKLEHSNTFDINDFQITFSNGVRLKIDDQLGPIRNRGSEFEKHVDLIDKYIRESFDVRTPQGLSKAQEIKKKTTEEIETIERRIESLEEEKAKKLEEMNKYRLSYFGEKAKLKKAATERFTQIEKDIEELQKRKSKLIKMGQ